MKKNAKPSLRNAFLSVYFFELEKQLNQINNHLQHLKFQSEESNTDEFLKKYFKAYFLKNNTIKKSSVQKLCLKVDSTEHIIDVHDLYTYKITNVFLPEELNQEHKAYITRIKKSVYTNPDLYLAISDGNKTYFESVELKSTKGNKIPGSSVQQVLPFEWVIFVKRTNTKVSITTGHYLNSITNKLPFPDRSPRPQIAYKTLENWNKKYRRLEGQVLTIENITELNRTKMNLLSDWQDHLTNEWMQVIQAESTLKGEKRFNRAIRKFTVKLLNFTDKLTLEEREMLKEKLKRMTK